ncbi:MAG TPA: protein phosphatase 2C domain-containing protein [Burkholderiales bacterium]|nr:protein phosphatase 2C domain-containing protein [Burkholderiales bacterium]
MSRLALDVAARSDLGRVRSFNEDSFVTDAERGVVAVADGMAEHKGADLAAKLATATLVQSLIAGQNLAPRAATHAAFAAANRAIVERARADPTLKGMGTTLALAWFQGDRVSIAHVGDSRVYRWRAGRLERLTTDHSFVQSQLSAGQMTSEEARVSRSRQLVTRVLGAEEQVVPDLGEHEVLPGDVYLLCTDGLHDLVEDGDIASALEVLAPNVDLAAATLIAMANDRGGRDNVSVVVARVDRRREPKRAREPEPQGFFGWLRTKLGS